MKCWWGGKWECYLFCKRETVNFEYLNSNKQIKKSSYCTIYLCKIYYPLNILQVVIWKSSKDRMDLIMFSILQIKVAIDHPVLQLNAFLLKILLVLIIVFLPSAIAAATITITIIMEILIKFRAILVVINNIRMKIRAN